MKDYKRYIIWLDYFASSLSHSEGRRVGLDKAVSTPTLEELEQAAKLIGLAPDAVQCTHPRRTAMKSGYISVERRGQKSQLLKELAMALSGVKGEKRRHSSH
ncbi:MAG: hypothetical protein CMO12_03090 [Thaumarchaeota archaeon]|jgi:signal recognition particle subunit SEC65|nr:hypothetical protein [Nitrososphaerota archaeon]